MKGKWLYIGIAAVLIVVAIGVVFAVSGGKVDGVDTWLMTSRVICGQDAKTFDYDYDSNGNLVQVVSYMDELENKRYVNTYDADGKCVRTLCYLENTLYSTTEYTYSSAGKLIQQIETIEGKGSSGYAYVYTAGGRLVEVIRYENGVECYRNTFEYTFNEWGKPETKRIYRNDVERSSYTYSYDAQGNLAKVVKCIASDPAYRGVFSYSANGDILEITEYSGDLELCKCVYSYDSDGNLTEYIRYENGEEVSRETYHYEMKQIAPDQIGAGRGAPADPMNYE